MKMEEIKRKKKEIKKRQYYLEFLGDQGSYFIWYNSHRVKERNMKMEEIKRERNRR